LGPVAKHDDGDDGNRETEHTDYADDGNGKNAFGYVVTMMAIVVAVVSLVFIITIDGESEFAVLKFVLDPLLDLVGKLVGCGRDRRSRRRKGRDGSSRCGGGG